MTLISVFKHYHYIDIVWKASLWEKLLTLLELPAYHRCHLGMHISDTGKQDGLHSKKLAGLVSKVHTLCAQTSYI